MTTNEESLQILRASLRHGRECHDRECHDRECPTVNLSMVGTTGHKMVIDYLRQDCLIKKMECYFMPPEYSFNKSNFQLLVSLLQVKKLQKLELSDGIIKGLLKLDRDGLSNFFGCTDRLKINFFGQYSTNGYENVPLIKEIVSLLPTELRSLSFREMIPQSLSSLCKKIKEGKLFVGRISICFAGDIKEYSILVLMRYCNNFTLGGGTDHHLLTMIGKEIKEAPKLTHLSFSFPGLYNEDDPSEFRLFGESLSSNKSLKKLDMLCTCSKYYGQVISGDHLLILLDSLQGNTVLEEIIFPLVDLNNGGDVKPIAKALLNLLLVNRTLRVINFDIDGPDIIVSYQESRLWDNGVIEWAGPFEIMSHPGLLDRNKHNRIQRQRTLQNRCLDLIKKNQLPIDELPVLIAKKVG